MARFNDKLAENIAAMRGNIYDIFPKEQVIGSFVCGSVVRQEMPTSDIDVFICCQDEITEMQRHDWTEYYLDLHESFNKDPDVVSPGEVMSASALQYGLARIANTEPATALRNRYEFDYLCWAGMIDSKRIDVVRTDRFVTFERLAQGGITKWSQALLSGHSITRKTGEITDADRMLARTVSCKGYYDAHE